MNILTMYLLTASAVLKLLTSFTNVLAGKFVACNLAENSTDEGESGCVRGASLLQFVLLDSEFQTLHLTRPTPDPTRTLLIW